MIYNIDYFREHEEKLLAEAIAKNFSKDMTSISTPTDIEVNNTFKLVHNKMVSTLISYYMSKCCLNYSHSNYSDFFEAELVQVDILPPDIDCKSIPQICEALHVAYLNSLYTYKNGRISRKKSRW